MMIQKRRVPGCVYPLLALLSCTAQAQTIDLYAGGSVGDGQAAVFAQLRNPQGLIFDAAGNLSIADAGDGRVRRVDTAGVIRTAICGVNFEICDRYPIQQPSALTYDAAGYLYIADAEFPEHISKSLPNGWYWTLLAGDGPTTGPSPDGVNAATAGLGLVGDIAVDGDGTVYFSEDNRVRSIDAAGVLGSVPGLWDLRTGKGMTLDASGLYVADAGTHVVFHVDRSGQVSVVAGTLYSSGYSGDGALATAAQLNAPNDVKADKDGNLYIVDAGNHAVRRVDHGSGMIATVAGTGSAAYSSDGGLATESALYFPYAVAFDSAGTLYVSEQTGRVRHVRRDGRIETFAGGAAYPAGLRRQDSWLEFPRGVATDSAGALYIADSGNYRVRRIAPDGTATTFAGNGATIAAGDGGPAIDASFGALSAVGVDAAGNVYIGDGGTVRQVDAAGTIRTIAGGGAGIECVVDSAPALSAHLFAVDGMAFDPAGNLLIVDSGCGKVLKLDASGTLAVVAGAGGFGYSGDGGPALAAKLNSPRGIAVDRSGNLFIADMGSDRVRRVDTYGTITTFAGTGDEGFSGDGGPAADAHLCLPNALVLDEKGNLYISDYSNGRIRKVSSDGSRIDTVAGGGLGFGSSGDGGPALDASFMSLTALAWRGGMLYVAESYTDRVRAVTFDSIFGGGFEP